MDDLISRSVLLDDIRKTIDASGCVNHEGEMLDCIRYAPAVDAVEVVRCRECKYHNKPPCPMRLSFNWTEDNNFCSYGERKEGADND